MILFIGYSCCQGSVLGITDNFLLLILGMYELKDRFIHVLFHLYWCSRGFYVCVYVYLLSQRSVICCMFRMIRNLHFISLQGSFSGGGRIDYIL